MSIKLYYDLMSQPSRALYILLKYAKVPFEPMPVDLRSGKHFEPEFEKINPLKKVPVLEHNGFILTESVAIIQYLAKEKLIPEKLFPKDTKLEARVNEFLSWHHIGIRAPCAMYFRGLAIEPMLTGKSPTPQKVETLKKRMNEALDLVEERWLTNGKYIVGDSLTVADVFGCCEIEQPRMVAFEPTEGRPRMTAWMQRVKDELNPCYDEGHAVVNKIAKKQFSKKGVSKL